MAPVRTCTHLSAATTSPDDDDGKVLIRSSVFFFFQFFFSFFTIVCITHVAIASWENKESTFFPIFLFSSRIYLQREAARPMGALGAPLLLSNRHVWFFQCAHLASGARASYADCASPRCDASPASPASFIDLSHCDTRSLSFSRSSSLFRFSSFSRNSRATRQGRRHRAASIQKARRRLFLTFFTWFERRPIKICLSGGGIKDREMSPPDEADFLSDAQR